MTRSWSKPLFGVQCMLGLPRGYAAVVEDFGSVAEASVRSPVEATVRQSFDDADSARRWAEEQGAVVCQIELPTATFALSGDFRSFNQTAAVTTVFDLTGCFPIPRLSLGPDWGCSSVPVAVGLV